MRIRSRIAFASKRFEFVSHKHTFFSAKFQQSLNFIPNMHKHDHNVTNRMTT